MNTHMIDRIQGTHTYSTVQYSTYLDGGRNLAPFPESNVANKDHFLDAKVVLGYHPAVSVLPTNF